MTDPTPSKGAWDSLADFKAKALDESRPDSVAKQRARGTLTARERVAALVDTGSFLEYGMLAGPVDPAHVAPADGVIMGTARLGGHPVAVVSCDFTAMGGSVGLRGHAKLTRFFSLLDKLRHPVILLSEGGGTRIQEMEHIWTATDLYNLAKLSGKVPLIGVVLGRAFAFQANIIGLCDVVIMTKASSMGISGPPLVAAALGRTMSCEEIGAAPMHAQAGTADLVVDTDQDAIEAVRRYFAFFASAKTDCADDRGLVESLRTMVPENPRRAYDMRKLIGELADRGTMMELRAEHAKNGVTALARLGGMSVGIVANQSLYLGGALDAAVCEKFARFITLCGRFGIPLVFLVDTPGFMVGPEAEQDGLVRISCRPVMALLELQVPFATILLRKAYGTGSWAMGGDSFEPVLYAAWPTAEFGGMGLKGASDILEARNDDAADGFLDRQKQLGTALSIARRYQVDDVIDPAQTRGLLIAALHGAAETWASRRGTSGTPVAPIPSW